MSLATRLTKLEAARPMWRDTRLDLDALSPRARDVLTNAYGVSLNSDHPDAVLDALRASVAAAQGEGGLDLSQMPTADLEALVALWEDLAL